MLLTLRNAPLGPTTSISSEIDRMFDSLFAPSCAGAYTSVFPAFNIAEDDKAFFIEAELPGFASPDLDIEVQGDTVTLRGKRAQASEQASLTVHRRERWSGEFERSVTLPSDVDAEAVTATLSQGVLRVTLPKSERARARRVTVAGS